MTAVSCVREFSREKTQTDGKSLGNFIYITHDDVPVECDRLCSDENDTKNTTRMANEEVLGPRKTMIVLVIVVGCFAVLWPRILSPLLLGTTRDQLQPNQFDRDAGCCEVLFETEIQVLEVLSEICSASVQANGKLTPYAAAECRRAVNETCGVDIAAFLKRTDNVGRTTKMLLETMKASNSSCLKEHFGVPIWSLSNHPVVNAWILQNTLKQERPATRGMGPHPALRERGRAIPNTPPPTPRPQPLPAHIRVRSSPLDVYFELDIKPPPIPGMRPPLGSPGGPVPAPKSSMGFVMPIYTICICVFFVYTLSKILFKRVGTTPYEPVSPDPQFRRRVFRDESRSSQDKLVVTAISGLVAEVQQQMEAGYAHNQQRQDVQDNHARPYTNGTLIHSGPVQIVASEYRDPSKERTLVRDKEPTPELNEPRRVLKEPSPELNEPTPELKEPSREVSPELIEPSPESRELSPVVDSTEHDDKFEEESPEKIEESAEVNEVPEITEESPEEIEETLEHRTPRTPEPSPEVESTEKVDANHVVSNNLIKLLESKEKEIVGKSSNDFLNEERESFRIVSTPELESSKEEKQSTPELLEEALKEDSPVEEDEEIENGSVKVVGMEMRAQAAGGPALALQPRAAPVAEPAAEVKAIYLDTEIPQQSRVLVADFEDSARAGAEGTANKHAPSVVSGKMTLSLIQDAPRDTPERDLESTFEDFTTASAYTQPAAEKDEEQSDEEVDEEVEVEEIEEEVEIEEDEDEDESPVKIEEMK